MGSTPQGGLEAHPTHRTSAPRTLPSGSRSRLLLLLPLASSLFRSENPETLEAPGCTLSIFFYKYQGPTPILGDLLIWVGAWSTVDFTKLPKWFPRQPWFRNTNPIFHPCPYALGQARGKRLAKSHEAAEGQSSEPRAPDLRNAGLPTFFVPGCATQLFPYLTEFSAHHCPHYTVEEIDAQGGDARSWKVGS